MSWFREIRGSAISDWWLMTRQVCSSWTARWTVVGSRSPVWLPGRPPSSWILSRYPNGSPQSKTSSCGKSSCWKTGNGYSTRSRWRRPSSPRRSRLPTCGAPGTRSRIPRFGCWSGSPPAMSCARYSDKRPGYRPSSRMWCAWQPRPSTRGSSASSFSTSRETFDPAPS